MLPAFLPLKTLSLPVAPEKAGQLQYNSIVQHTEGDRAYLPAFTDPAAAPSPHLTLPVPETASLFFHATRHEFFVFNPPGQSSLKAGRADISLIAGFLQAGGAAEGDPVFAATREAGAGNLHKAHYFYTLAEEKAGSGARMPLCAILIELGLYQEAYDILKAEKSPEALLLLSLVHRRTGNQQRAAEALAAVPSGTPLEEKRALEAAWLDLEAGRDDDAERAFERLSASALEKTEALAGLGTVRAKKAFRTKDAGRLAAASTALRSALATTSPASGRLYFQLGNLYFRSGNSVQAEDCYRKAAAFSPGLQALANLAATLVRTGKFQEAAAIAARIALTDPASAKRLADQLPAGSVSGEVSPQLYSQAPAGGRPQPGTPPQAGLPPALNLGSKAPPQPSGPVKMQEFRMETLQEAMAKTPAPSGNEQPESGRMNELKLDNLGAPPGAEPGQASLEPAAPRLPPNISNRQFGKPAGFESFSSGPQSSSGGGDAWRRPEDFLSGAFKLASDLEREFGSKVHFNREGLADVEKKLRLFTKQAKFSSAPGLIQECAAFLCYFLQERHKGRLVKLAGLEPWAWPMIFDTQETKITTYPVQRLWRLLWDETLPETGWLVKYTEWLTDAVKGPRSLLTGSDAVKERRGSHPERLADTQTEHKRMLLLISTLAETSGIELGRTGVIKLDLALKKNFKPDIPPSADGWKLLRCYGHLLAAILAKDFKAAWFHTDGEDGHWSMRLPWDTFVFPIGKIYKTASHREELLEYYDALLSERVRSQGQATGRLPGVK